MKVRELIEQLGSFNQDAEVVGVVDYCGYSLKEIGYGGGDGCKKENCGHVSLHFTYDNGETETNF